MWHTYEAHVQVGLSQNIGTAWVKFRKWFTGTSGNSANLLPQPVIPHEYGSFPMVGAFQIPQLASPFHNHSHQLPPHQFLEKNTFVLSTKP